MHGGLPMPVPLFMDADSRVALRADALPERPAPRSKIIDVAALGPPGALDVEQVMPGVVRLTRHDDARPVEEVILFVADSGSRVIAAQSVRQPPYSALFDVTPRVAFAGVTIIYDDGVRSTTLVPYRQ